MNLPSALQSIKAGVPAFPRFEQFSRVISMRLLEFDRTITFLIAGPYSSSYQESNADVDSSSKNPFLTSLRRPSPFVSLGEIL